MTGVGLPRSHPAVSHVTARALLASQHPDLAHLPLGARHDGWDMAMFRLGDDLAVRMPRTSTAVESLEAESTLAARLSEAWTFPFPRVLRRGEPGQGFPWPWSVVAWLEGDIAAEVPLHAGAGEPVGAALAQIHQPAPPDARFNSEQSVPIRAREPATLEFLAALARSAGPNGERLNSALAHEMWSAAAHAPAPEPDDTVWSHADLHGFNVLSDGGRFAGIIDWADIAGCDPAVDLGFLFTFMPAAGVSRAWSRYASVTGRAGDALWARARGIGLSKCADLARWDRPKVSATGWRGLVALGVAA
ncbi:MAG: phosphotransferase [Demequina sp.]